MWSWLVAACGGGVDVPPGVPEGALHGRVVGDHVEVAGQRVGPVADLQAYPTHEAHPPLVEALRAHGGHPLWLDLPPDTPFFEVRKIINSADAAGLAPIVLSTRGSARAVPIVAPPQYGLAGRCEAPLSISGATPLITVSIQRDVVEQHTWLLASARFLPVVDRGGRRGPVDGLPQTCLTAPPCADGVETDLVSACQAGANAPQAAPERVMLGGPTGCLAPLVSASRPLDGWRRELPVRIASLGLDEQPLVMIMPEALVRVDSLLTVLEAFDSTPAVGLTLLIQGNDGAPSCTAEVQDRQALSAAGARWIGSHVPPRGPDLDPAD